MKKFRGFKPSSVLSAPLINTHFQVGVATAELYPNRFNPDFALEVLSVFTLALSIG